MEEERKDSVREAAGDLPRPDEEGSEEKNAEEIDGDIEDSKEDEKGLETAAAELLEKHPEIGDRLKAGEELFKEGFFENLKAGMNPCAAFEHEELKSRLAAAEAEAERYKELYKSENRLRMNKERSSGSLKGEDVNDSADFFDLGFLED